MERVFKKRILSKNSKSLAANSAELPVAVPNIRCFYSGFYQKPKIILECHQCFVLVDNGKFE